MMRSVNSDSVSDFAEIYADDVELISVDRPNHQAIESLSQDLIQSRKTLELQWVQAADDCEAANDHLPETVDDHVKSMLVEQVKDSCEMLGALLGCDNIGVRLATLRSPMCPKFHVDNIPCRLLITLTGEGTEWIPHGDVNWPVFSDLSNNDTPARTDSSVKKLAAGQWSLLKGGSWKNNYQGVVHRSPEGSHERLLLSLDPIFND